MEDISYIVNGEQLTSARNKLNTVITRINQAGNLSSLLSEVSTALIQMNALKVAAEAEVSLMRSLSATIQSQGYLSANRMEVDYPSSISIRRSLPPRITVRLYPVYALQNVLYLPAGGDSLEVTPDGFIHVRHLGTTRIHVIPPGRTLLYRTVDITVRPPNLRKCGGALRLTQTNSLRIV